MQAIIFMILICALSVGSSFLQKKFQMQTSENLVNFTFYNFVNAALACVYFYIASGFDIKLNMPTIIYSVVFAVIVFLTLVMGICILSRVQIATASVVNSAGSIIVSSVFGIIYFGESLTVSLLCAMVMMLFAAIIPLRFTRQENLKSEKPCVKILICIMSFTLSGAANIISKLYAENPDVTDTISFFFFTNVILVAASFLVLAFLSFKNKIPPKQIVRTFTPGQIGNVAARTAIANISSVLTVVVLSMMNVSLYTVMMSAFGTIISAVMSLVFRESMKLRNWISVALAVLAGIILNI